MRSVQILPSSRIAHHPRGSGQNQLGTELEDQIAAIVRAVRDNGPLAATGEDGRWSVLLCTAAQKSVETGKCVLVADYLA